MASGSGASGSDEPVSPPGALEAVLDDRVLRVWNGGLMSADIVVGSPSGEEVRVLSDLTSKGAFSASTYLNSCANI